MEIVFNCFHIWPSLIVVTDMYGDIFAFGEDTSSSTTKVAALNVKQAKVCTVEDKSVKHNAS